MGIDLRLAVTDLTVGDLHVAIKCPDEIHRARLNGKIDKTSSLAVYPDHLHCYGCDYHESDRWVALKVLLKLPDLQSVKDVLDRYKTESVDGYRERVEQTTKTEPLHAALAQVYHEMLVKGPRYARQTWLWDRGLSQDTITQHQIGHDGKRFVLPVYDWEGHLRTFRYRRDDYYFCTCEAFNAEGDLLREHTETCGVHKYPKYCGIEGRNGQFLYPILGDIEALPALYLCEGEFDALLMNQLRYPALTVTNGAGQVKKIPAIIKDRWPHIHTLYIATDQDEAGEEAARLTLKAATELGFNVERLRWPEAKDITDAVKAGTFPLG